MPKTKIETNTDSGKLQTKPCTGTHHRRRDGRQKIGITLPDGSRKWGTTRAPMSDDKAAALAAYLTKHPEELPRAMAAARGALPAPAGEPLAQYAER